MTKDTIIEVQYTDTFGGEANYAWLHLQTYAVPADKSDSWIKRFAKKSLNINGVPGKWEESAEGFTFRPHGMNTVLFVTFL